MPGIINSNRRDRVGQTELSKLENVVEEFLPCPALATV